MNDFANGISLYELAAGQRFPQSGPGLDGERGMSQFHPAPYQSFLLRCWKEVGNGHEEEGSWRVSIESITSDQHRHGFHSLEEAFAFLQSELQGVSGQQS